MSSFSIDDMAQANSSHQAMFELANENKKLREALASYQAQNSNQKNLILDQQFFNNIYHGDRSDLYQFKTFSRKAELLEQAVNHGDAHVLIQIAIFLRATLSPSLFLQLLKQYPLALNSYLAYLNTDYNITYNKIDDEYLNSRINENNRTNFTINNNNNNTNYIYSDSDSNSQISHFILISQINDALNRGDEAASNLFSAACLVPNISSRLDRLKNCSEYCNQFINKFSNNTNNPNLSASVSSCQFIMKQCNDYIYLLQQQELIDRSQINNDNNDNNNNNSTSTTSLKVKSFLSFSSNTAAPSPSPSLSPNRPTSSSQSNTNAKLLKFKVLGTPLSKTLSYLFMFNQSNNPDNSAKNEKDKAAATDPTSVNNLPSTSLIIKKFNVNDKAYTWNALNSYSSVRDWDSVTKLVEPGGWFSSASSPIGLEPFLVKIQQANGPMRSAEYFVNLIKDNDEKYRMAMKYQLFEIAISVITETKSWDRIIPTSKIIVDKLGVSERSEALRHSLNLLLSDPKVSKQLRSN